MTGKLEVASGQDMSCQFQGDPKYTNNQVAI